MKNLNKLIPARPLIEKRMKDPEFIGETAAFDEYYKTLVMLKETRKKARLSQLDLARKSNVPVSIISKIENGKRNPTIETLSKLAYGMNKKLEIRFV